MGTEFESEFNKLKAIVSVGEVAKLLRVTRQTITKWVRDGKLRCMKPGDRTLLFQKEDLKKFIQKSFK